MYICDLDWRDPLAAFAPLAGEAHAHILHGGDRSEAAEWTIIVAFPTGVVTENAESGDFFRAINGALESRRSVREERFAKLPFVSGAVGFVGYEAARHLEPGLALPRSPFSFPDAEFGFYDAAALFSRKSRKAYIAGRSKGACDNLRDALGKGARTGNAPEKFGMVSSNFSPLHYKSSVARIIERIRDGAYYQVNLSQQLKVQSSSNVNAFGLFQRLVAQSDAPHAAFLQLEAVSIVSNSPERFFRVEPGASGRRIVAEPIKGTRRRGRGPEEDKGLSDELLRDPKDRAENIMIADLVRNDLSRICRDGSIAEEAVCELASFANVHHLVSRISGILGEGVTFSEIFKALFPCGSVTGAPKVAAMEEIADGEGVGRGPYCGAIGYIDDAGQMDFSVAIRTLMVESESVILPVGGGVTLRSDPSAEFQETLTKASGALSVLDGADLAALQE